MLLVADFGDSSAFRGEENKLHPIVEKQRDDFPVIPERRGKMRARDYLFLLMVAGLCLGFALGPDDNNPAVDENYAVQPRPEVLYGQHIDGIIERGRQQCDRLSDTRSSHLQADAEFMARKVAFCEQNREALIREMVSAGIPASPNPVKKFVIDRFVGNGNEQTASLYR